MKERKISFNRYKLISMIVLLATQKETIVYGKRQAEINLLFQLDKYLR